MKWKATVTLLLSLLLFTACSAGNPQQKDDSSENQNSDITSISDLTDTDDFRDGALEHILEGELNREGDAVGFHYEGFPTTNGSVVDGTETEPNEYGVYEAEIEVEGEAKTSNSGKSSLFPEKWDGQQVVDAIKDAYDSKTLITGNTYEGLTQDGMVIRMYLDQKDKIISAFPMYE